MRRLTTLIIALLLLATAGCSRLWADVMAGQMADNLMAMNSYHGTLVQKGLLPDAPQTAVVEDVLYAKPWRVRAEVTAPAALKGSVFIYDGEQLLMWWPQQLLGIHVRGLKNPSRDEVVGHIQREMANAMDHYAFSLHEGQTVAGQPVARWQMTPLQDEPFRLHHTSWVYARYALPLKMEFMDRGKPWYSMEYTNITFDVPVADNTFVFQFPENALVLDWDMQAPGITLDQARRKMNFTVMQPTALPPGHSLRKIAPSTSCLPMIALQYDQGASVISLTESRAWGKDQLMAFGKPVKIGSSDGWLYFAGTYSVISWIKGNTMLTLMGNLSFPQMITIARSVE